MPFSSSNEATTSGSKLGSTSDGSSMRAGGGKGGRKGEMRRLRLKIESKDKRKRISSQRAA